MFKFILGFLFFPVIIFTHYYMVSFGYDVAIKSAIVDKVIFKNGKIYSVKDTGQTYPLK